MFLLKKKYANEVCKCFFQRMLFFLICEFRWDSNVPSFSASKLSVEETKNPTDAAGLRTSSRFLSSRKKTPRNTPFLCIFVVLPGQGIWYEYKIKERKNLGTKFESSNSQSEKCLFCFFFKQKTSFFLFFWKLPQKCPAPSGGRVHLVQIWLLDIGGGGLPAGPAA